MLPLWLFAVMLLICGKTFAQNQPWPRYTIDSSQRGADGVRLADANGDGRPDIATGWEESGTTRIYLHPGTAAVREAWPSCTVGPSPSVEDAVWVDFNGDGRLDVLSSCEGKEQSLRVHIAPPVEEILQTDRWLTHTLDASREMTRWMFALPVPEPLQPEYIVVGSKNPNGIVGLLQPAASFTSCRVRTLCSAQWIMSLESLDVDGDGDLDILFSDRKGDQSGVYWLENPGTSNLFSDSVTEAVTWNKHLIGGLAREVMFLHVLRPGAGSASGLRGGLQLVVAAKERSILWMKQAEDPRRPWASEELSVGNADFNGRAKSAVAADFDGDGQLELAFSCESATPPLSGIVWLDNVAGVWETHDLSGPEGIKFDLLQPVDLDFDGDLDIVTCEEQHNGRGLGVIWYANPRLP